jgi:selenocysteine lyase/cysteine desulfurase
MSRAARSILCPCSGDYSDDDSSWDMPASAAEAYEGIPLVLEVSPHIASRPTQTRSVHVRVGERGEASDQVISYFNNAAKTPLSKSVQEAGECAMRQQANPWEAQQDELPRVRELYSMLLKGSSPDDICIAPSTAFAMTMAAHNLERLGILQKDDSILVLENQYDSVIYPFQDVCQRTGACLAVIPHPTVNQTWTCSILDRLNASNDSTSRIKVAILPSLHWANGSLLDLVSISEACQVHNVLLLVDATQSLGVLELDLTKVKADMVAASVHKWLLGPVGLSLVYLAPRHQTTWLPLDQHGRARQVPPGWNASSDMMDPISGFYPSLFQKGAQRCDSGGKPNPILIPMIRAGLEQVTQQSLPDIQQKLVQVTNAVVSKAQPLGFVSVPGPRGPHIVGLQPGPSLIQTLTPQVMLAMAERLAKNKGIYVAVRCGGFRISPYLDTTLHDVDRLIDALAQECLRVQEERKNDTNQL